MGLIKKVFCRNENCGYRLKQQKRGRDRKLWMADVYLEGHSTLRMKCPNCRTYHEFDAEQKGVLMTLPPNEIQDFLIVMEKYAFQEPQVLAGLRNIRENLEFWHPEYVRKVDITIADVVASLAKTHAAH